MKPSKPRRYNKKLVLFSLLLSFVLIGVLLQANNEPVINKPVLSEIQVPQNVAVILERACYNCHSNESNLKWYDKIAPISWKVKEDVYRAREVMNFSEFGNLSKAEYKGTMWAILNMVKSGRMPLKSYVAVHPEAKVTEAEVTTIQKYVLSITDHNPKTPTEISASNEEYEKWKDKVVSRKNIPESPNGVKYSDDFKNWKVISMSTLYDNSMRVIYGNDIAVKAIKEERFHPWPDGAIVVKVVWEQVENKYGEVRPGKFINAQFMVKDAKKYKDTEGWGFAKFSTQELIPTGKTAAFASKSCINCHRQLAEETGFLFNVPLKLNPKL